MSYVSYAVGPSVPLGPRSVGALGLTIYEPKTGTKEVINFPHVNLSPEEQAVLNDAVATKLWDRLAPYRVGMTDQQQADFMLCQAKTLNIPKCQAQVKGEGEIPLWMILGGGSALLGAIWYVTKR